MGDMYFLNPESFFRQFHTIEVPGYQRPYSWTTEHRKDFWDDIVKQIIRRKMDSAESQYHFLGSIVVQKIPTPAERTSEKFNVIDGQQRLVTISIFTAALLAVSKNLVRCYGINNPDIQSLFDAMTSNQVLISDRYTDERTLETVSRNKLKLISGNNQDYEDIVKILTFDYSKESIIKVQQTIDDINSPDENGSISPLKLGFIEFYNLITEYISEDPYEASKAVKNISNVLAVHLKFAVIGLSETDNAQEIFEALNARMEKLSPSDLIKNFIMMSVSSTRVSDAGNDFYEKHWKHFENDATFWKNSKSIAFSAGSGIDHMRSFLYYLLIAETSDQKSKLRTNIELIDGAKLHRAYKEHIENLKNLPDGDNELLAFAKKISSLAKFYKLSTEEAANPKTSFDSENGYIYKFIYRIIDTFKFRPLWSVLIKLELLRDTAKPGEIELAISTLESWAVRRMLIGQSSTADLQTFTRKIMDLISKDENATTPGTAIKKLLDSKNSGAKYIIWPNKNFLARRIVQTPFNKTPDKKRVRVVLEAIEDYIRGYDQKKVSSQKSPERVKRGFYSPEYILPLNGKEENWPASESFDIKHRHDINIHLLGNFALSGYQDKKWKDSNNWDTKKKLIEDTSVSLPESTRQLAFYDKWDEKSIEERTIQLLNIIEILWPSPLNTPDSITISSRARTNEDFIEKITDYLKDNCTIEGESIRIYPNKNTPEVYVDMYSHGKYVYNDIDYPSLNAIAKDIAKDLSNNVYKYWYFKDETGFFDAKQRLADEIPEVDKYISLDDIEKFINSSSR